ncbi:hypothetical protein NEMIN01_1279 [Nematocida minor]|uniref:uncharacterized protein n=1 Tax=Nematocida minor TaxID=1912983 RepID=UPI00221FEB27|nr:uncharacterized protein NEMIN01_1279 [Nematocida minor]KAI5190946.1 hypothetical protein NEMIN01_1279 [Nematocida minor]
MDTVVVVFETLSLVSLKTLSETAKTLLYPLRIFPVQVQRGKIVKRWALIKTDKDFSFVEKEEKCENLRDFIDQLRKASCTVLVDVPDKIAGSCYFKIDTGKKELIAHTDSIELDRVQISDVVTGIIQASNIFFKKAILSLTGIRIRNKNGKKETVDITIGIEKIEYLIPTEMSMIQTQPKGIVMMSSTAAVNSQLLLKVLSRSMLYFTGDKPGLFLRLEIVEDRPIAILFRQADCITVLDSSLPFMKKHYLEEYLHYLLKKYGEEIKAIVGLLFEKCDKKEPDLILAEETQRVLALSADKKNKAILSIYDMVSTLHFPEKDTRSFLIASLKKTYIEIIKKQKTEGVTVPMCIHISPDKKAHPSSLHTLFKEIEM